MWRSAALLALVACSSKPATPKDATIAEGTPYGTWPSPITAAEAIAGGREIRDLTVTADASWWIAPGEHGAHALIRRDRQGKLTVVAPDVSTEAHAYGGAAYAVVGDEVFVSSAADGRLYRITGTTTMPVTPAGKHHWADCVPDPTRQRLLCVHDDATFSLPLDTIDTISLVSPRTDTLIYGHDFFAAPRISPDGRTLAWVSWDFPRMPWDGSDLWTAPISNLGAIGEPVHVAGGRAEAVSQPTWSPEGVLHYLSDRGGTWAIYRADREAPLTPSGAEVIVGYQAPGALFGEPAFAFADADHLVVAYALDGVDHAAVIDPRTGTITPLAVPGTVMLSLAAGAGRAMFLVGAADRPPTLVELDFATGTATTLVEPPAIDPKHVSMPETILFPTDDSAIGEAYFYPPRGQATAPAGERPPLIVRVHGGPVARTVPMWSPDVQFWTSRGFAVVDVNYGGSVGYGRAYRERLMGEAGVVDVADCVAAAHVLVLRGDVDRARLVIRGGSAGGYTALMATIGDHGFASAAAWAGYSDIEALDRDTAASDKFESHFDEMLIGPYPARKEVYVARSPIHHADQVVTPILFVHGDEDPVVPASQSRLMHEALDQLGKPNAYIELSHAGHGTGALQARADALEEELAWHRKNLQLISK